MTAMTGIAAAALLATLGAAAPAGVTDPVGAGTVKAKFGPPPVATITKPASPLTKQSLHGQPVKITFAGKGVTAAKKPVPGTWYRWTAYGTGGVKKTLCVGSSVPTPGPIDKLAIYRDCASFTAELGMLYGDVASTTWTVKLEVFTSSSAPGADTVPVKLVYIAL